MALTPHVLARLYLPLELLCQPQPSHEGSFCCHLFFPLSPRLADGLGSAVLRERADAISPLSFRPRGCQGTPPSWGGALPPFPLCLPPSWEGHCRHFGVCLFLWGSQVLVILYLMIIYCYTFCLLPFHLLVNCCFFTYINSYSFLIGGRGLVETKGR